MGARSLQRGTGRVRLGVVGAGRWGRRLIATVQSLPDVDLVAVCSRTNDGASALPVAWFGDWKALIASGLCDGIVIATPPDTHVPIALEALEADVAVMIEKPLALTLEDASRLGDYVTQRVSCPAILVDHTHLFAPAYQKLKSLIRSPMVSIETRGASFEPWRPYSSLLDFGPHDLAMVLDLMGTSPERVTCRVVSEVVHESLDGPRVHQLFEIAMTFRGARASCVVGNGAPVKERRVEVTCENGDRLVYDDGHDTFKTHFNAVPVDLGLDKPLFMAMDAFTKALCGYVDPRYGLGLAIEVQTVMDVCIGQVETR